MMIIYKTTNLINGKIYIGYDTKNNPNYLGSGADFKTALKELGKESFVKVAIDFADNLKDLCLKERFWIKFYRDQGFDLYNITDGGNGSAPGERHPLYGKRGELSPNFGSHRSEATKAKIGLARTGKLLSEEHKQKIALARLGTHHSDGTIAKWRDGSRKGLNNPMHGRRGEKNPMYGKKRPEHSKLMSDGRNKGQNNPNSKTNRERRKQLEAK